MPMYVDNAIAQFENVNALRSLPFTEGSSLTARDGKTLPKDVVVDVHMVVPVPADSSYAPEVKLTSVHISPKMVSACFKSEIGGKVNALAVMVAAENFMPYRPYMLEKLYGSEDIGGVVTFGDMERPGFPETYFLDNAVVSPCCIAAAVPAKLRGIVDLRSGTHLSGDVRISFSSHIRSEKKGNAFSLSLEDGSAEELASSCAGSSGAGVCGATPIVSINGVRPDLEGNIVLWFH